MGMEVKLLEQASIHFWLLLVDRLSTQAILQRKNMFLPTYNYVCCVRDDLETSVHLFITCPFAIACLSAIHLLVRFDNPFLVLEDFRLQLQVPFFHGYHHNHVLVYLDAKE